MSELTKEISCNKLGVENCDYVAEGETAGDVVTDMVKHLRARHGIDMPDEEVIISGKTRESILEQVDPQVKLIVKRLQEQLDMIRGQDFESSDETVPKPFSGPVG